MILGIFSRLKAPSAVVCASKGVIASSHMTVHRNLRLGLCMTPGRSLQVEHRPQLHHCHHTGEVSLGSYRLQVGATCVLAPVQWFFLARVRYAIEYDGKVMTKPALSKGFPHLLYSWKTDRSEAKSNRGHTFYIMKGTGGADDAADPIGRRLAAFGERYHFD